MKLLTGFLSTTILLCAPMVDAAAPSSLFGDWTTPDGATVRTYPCPETLCLKIVGLSPTVATKVDDNNPDVTLRKRPLCNLEIGSGFALEGETDATGGRLYDPESGKTYKGTLSLHGDLLKLRGYVGVALFGRTETWRRTNATKPCG